MNPINPNISNSSSSSINATPQIRDGAIARKPTLLGGARKAAMEKPLELQKTPVSEADQEKVLLNPLLNLSSVTPMPKKTDLDSGKQAVGNEINQPLQRSKKSQRPAAITSVAQLKGLSELQDSLSKTSNITNKQPEESKPVTDSVPVGLEKSVPQKLTDLQLCAKLFRKMKEPKVGEETKEEKIVRLKDNINTQKEILFGYKSVMSSEKLFEGLKAAYDKPDTTVKEKCAYQKFAIAWVRSGVFQEDLPKVESFIQDLIKDKDNVYADPSVVKNAVHLEKALSDIKNPVTDKSKKSSSEIKCKTVGEAANKLIDPAKVAKEFGDLLSQVQSHATINSILLSMGKPEEKLSQEAQSGMALPKAFDTLNRGIIDDIMYPTDKNKNKADGEKISERFNFYLHVAEEAINNGDPTTLLAVYTALKTPPIERLRLGEQGMNKELFQKVEAAAAQTLENISLRELYLKSNTNPIPSYILTDITSNKEKSSTVIIRQEQEYNSKNIADMGSILEGMSKRLNGMKARNAQTNLDLLPKKSIDPIKQEDQWDERSLEIKPRKK